MRQQPNKLLITLLVFVVGACGFYAISRLAYAHYKAQDECAERGGIVHEYNCTNTGCSSWQCVER